MSKLFSDQFQGLGLPPTYYKQNVGFPVQQLQIWNNSPITYTVKDTPNGLPYAVVPPFFSMSVNLPAFPGIALVGDATLPFTTSSLVIQLLDQVTGSPFSGQFGPSAWGAGSGPGVLTPINPGDQILAWQVQQILDFFAGSVIGNFSVTLEQPGLFQVRDNAGNIILSASIPNPPAPTLVEFATYQLRVTAGLRVSGGELESSEAIRVDKQSAPSVNAGAGKLYVLTDGTLHYLGPSGTDTPLAPA